MIELRDVNEEGTIAILRVDGNSQEVRVGTNVYGLTVKRIERGIEERGLDAVWFYDNNFNDLYISRGRPLYTEVNYYYK